MFRIQKQLVENYMSPGQQHGALSFDIGEFIEVARMSVMLIQVIEQGLHNYSVGKAEL